ncbi:MAG: aspartate kinase [Candidatus Bathyarchaeia archaeon]
MVHGRVVVKFGGADLATGEKVAQAARMVAEAPYQEKVVVVSAMGKTTDILVAAISQLGEVSDRDYAEIVSMGERTSARVFAGALRTLGAKAEVVDPADERWPIVTDSCFRDATPDYEATEARVRQFIAPLLKDTVPVVCGFLGRDPDGRVTTLGRGGSDTTALLLARCLDADEIVLVKETSGILSADPKIVPAARFLNRLDIHEAFDLVQGGAKIVKPEALKYKSPSQKLRVVSISSGNLAVGGTEITGSFNMNSAETNTHLGLISINIICEVNSENLKQAFAVLEGKLIYGVSSGKRSISIFTTDGDIATILNRLHSVSSFRAISHRENVAMLQIIHPFFVDSPGGVARISTALSEAGINIIEVTTSKATINVFIEESQIKRAKEAIVDAFKT